MSSISVYTNLQVPEKTALTVISNLRLLFKLSPHWDLISILPIVDASAQSPCKFGAVIKYYNDDNPKTLIIEAEPIKDNKSFSFKMCGDNACKRVEFFLDNSSKGAIGIAQKYSFDSEDKAIAESFSIELKYWHKAIVEYIKLQDGGGITKKCFRWFMNRIWLDLTLSQRKIAIILIKVSIVEIIALILFIIAWRIWVG